MRETFDNARMTLSKICAFCLLASVGLVACSPALNWRQLTIDSGDVQLLLPCKPDKARREVTLRVAMQEVPATLELQGCEASGMQFTFGQIQVPQGLQASAAVHAWRLASLAPLQIGGEKDQPGDWRLIGARVDPPPTRTRVMSAKHQAQFVWFAHGSNIYQAAVYGSNLDKGLPEAAETYFSGIKLP
jgi:hypothetical protein